MRNNASSIFSGPILPMKTILVGTGYIVVLIAFVIGIRLLLRSEIGLAILDILLGLFVAFAIGLIVRMKRTDD